jgi:outer membrane protein
MKTKQCESTTSRLTAVITLLLFATVTHAQSTLEKYVREGLENNLVLQQKNLSLDQAEKSLEIARSYFLPSMELLADYTSGEGGRSISIPVGDLLNPVYATLNQMTQSDAFPQIENVDQNFFPKNFYDAKVRASVPIFNTDLHYNRSIHGQQVMIKEYELEAYRRQLIMEIKSAYYNHLSAKAAVSIYESALQLLRKNVEVNESLLANGKSLPANLIRSKSELEVVRAEWNSAQNKEKNAKKYFNFLLNRDLSAEVDIDRSIEEYAIRHIDTVEFQADNREEVRLLKSLQDINKSSLKMKQLNRLPKIHAFLDVGTQASDWQFNHDSKYYLAGVKLSLPLFQGFRNNISIRQAGIEIEKTEKYIQNTTRQLELAAEIAKNDYQTSVQNYVAAKEQLKSAQSYFNLIEKGYRQGVNALIEFLDARNQLTSSQLQQTVRLFEMLTAEARVERETGSLPIEN